MTTITTANETADKSTELDIFYGNRFFHQCMAGLSAGLIMVAIACMAFFRYQFPFSELEAFVNLIPFAGAIGYCVWAKHHRLAQACSLAFWACALSNLLKFLLYVAARSPLPLQDDLLAHLDRRLGIEVPTILHFAALHSWIKATLSVSYDLLLPLMVLAAIIPALRYRFTAAKELIVSTSFATVVGSCLFAMWPAIGPWAVYRYAPSAIQKQTETLFLALRTTSVHAIDLNEPGFVCFPSFHVLLAILSAFALCSVKPLRIPTILIAGLVAISTLTTGWHYVTDVICGAILAVISVLAARLFSRCEARIACAKQRS